MTEHSSSTVVDALVVATPRIANPAVVPDALHGVQKLLAAVAKGGLPKSIIELTHMRASQINGCSTCIEGTIRHADKAGVELDDRLLMVAAWRHSSQFTAAERAALDLTEEITRMADRQDPVPDGTWARAAEHYGENALAALVLHVALVNMFNHINVSTRQPAGDW